MSLQSIDESELAFNDAPRLIWIPVQEAYKLLWPGNPKEHDIGTIVESIKKYGFQEMPKYDPAIGIKSGNGRIEALWYMENTGDEELPRGLAEDEGGGWVMPLLVGTDAPSEALAKAYALDANNLTMSGGEYTALEISRMWSQEKYLELLTELGIGDALPVSVDGDDLDLLRGVFEQFGEFIDKGDEERLEAVDHRIHIGVVIEEPAFFEDVARELRGLLNSHPEWEAKLEN